MITESARLVKCAAEKSRRDFLPVAVEFYSTAGLCKRNIRVDSFDGGAISGWPTA
ncbi:MAG: hypothetical protein H5T64_10685 [Chloroflexi bacterium]|nr:hypothetical protein [Chloroflexota bacterium]